MHVDYSEGAETPKGNIKCGQKKERGNKWVKSGVKRKLHSTENV